MKLLHISTFLQISAYIASAAIIDVSTTTSLPASPAYSDMDSCAFTDRVSLLNYIDSSSKDYNVSLLIKSCPSICLLVYGSGNPDISGIGAMISYTIQTVVIFTLAVVAFFFEFCSTDNLTARLDAIDLFSKLSVIVNKGNMFFSLSTLIASVIRIKQAPPLGELSFIRTLGLYQCSVCAGTIFQLHPTSLNRRFITLLFYISVTFIFATAVTFMDGVPSYQAKTLEKVTIACGEEDKFLAHIANPGKTNYFLLILNFIFWSLALGLIFIVPIFGVFDWQILLSIKKRISRAIFGLFHITVGRFAAIVVFIFLNIWHASRSITLILELQQQRSKILKLSGSADQDSVWGFGQVTIMLSWGPLIHDIIVELLEFYKPEDSEEAQLLSNIIGNSSLLQPKSLQSDALAGSDEADITDVGINRPYNFTTAQPSTNGPNNLDSCSPITNFIRATTPHYSNLTGFWLNFGILIMGPSFATQFFIRFLTEILNSEKSSAPETQNLQGAENTPTPNLE